MFISPQRRRRRQQSLLSPDISPQPSPLAHAAAAASKARSALAPTQTSNDDAASVDKRQPDAFKAFLDVAADLPEAAPPVLSLIHISEPTRLLSISYAVFCLKKKKR